MRRLGRPFDFTESVCNGEERDASFYGSNANRSCARAGYRCGNPPPPVTEPLLHFAARYGTEKTIRNLIASGSDVNLPSDDGCTALHIAAEKGRLDAVRILLELGADPGRENALGETAAQVAERSGQSEIAGILWAQSK